MRKESCIVGMVKTWTVVALESLINHCIAESIADMDEAIEAIENPKKNPNAKSETIKSDLAAKLLILANPRKDTDATYTSIADEISFIRNSIIHDKPFGILELRDGEQEITRFQKKGIDGYQQHNFESLAAFFAQCRTLIEYIDSNQPSIETTTALSFLKSLIGGNGNQCSSDFIHKSQDNAMGNSTPR